jgi:nucleotide-binding universal stress UspA family protein
MNTRGLMELVILNIGRELGVITDAVFAMMVIMALVTTALTTPILNLVYPQRLMEEKPATPAAGARRKFNVLIPVSDPASGAPLLRMAASFATEEERHVIALHLQRAVDREAYRAGIDDVASSVDPVLEPLLAQAETQKIEVEPVSFVGRDVPEDIASVARLRHADLVLMGFHRPVFGSAILGGTVHRVMRDVPADVGIFVNRGGEAEKKILVPYLGSTHDRLALELAQRLAKSTGALITVLHVVAPKRGDDQEVLGAKAAVDRVFAEPGHASPVTFKVIEDHSPVDAVLRESEAHDLVIIGVAEQWDLESHLFGFRPQRIAVECPKSLLIVRKFARGVAMSSATR